MLGEKLGSYWVVEKLGEGGMGVVFVGQHERLGNRAAIKMLLPDLSRNPEIVQRFFNEAQAATRIKHPGIVQVFDFGVHASGSAYIVMEFLEGESLAARLKRQGRLAPEAAVGIARQVCSALSAAHALGIVHRDLKPDNIFLVRDPDVAGGERTKILDFGIAKLAGEAGAGSVKTRTGSVMGTPYYMSPEQCRGAGEVDVRADLYSLGCILFEALCGRPPFVGEGVGEILGKQQFVEPPALRTLDPSITPALEAVIMRTLAKKPEDRQASLERLAKELEPFLPAPSAAMPAVMPPVAVPVTAVPSRAPITTMGSGAGEIAVPGTVVRRSRTLPIALAVAAVGAAAAVAVAVATSGGKPSANPTAAAATPAATTSAPAAPATSTPSSAASSASAPIVTNDKANRWIRVAPAGAEVILGITTSTRDGKRCETGLSLQRDGKCRITDCLDKEMQDRAVVCAGGGPVENPIDVTIMTYGGKDYADGLPKDVVGFRPDQRVAAPTQPYDLQQHEVTWGELDPWAEAHPAVKLDRPAWVPRGAQGRERLPVAGVSWEIAEKYCESVGGHLPSEAEWEFAARGAERRPFPWGKEAVDPVGTNVSAGKNVIIRAVMSSNQDRTPGSDEEAIFDLAGNVQEWTADAWVPDGGGERMVGSYAVRGLPLGPRQPKKPPLEGAAWRSPLCGAPQGCAKDAWEITPYVGFRCARALH